MTSATEKLKILPIEVRSVFSEMACDKAHGDDEFNGLINQYIHDFNGPLATLEKRAFDEGFKAAMDYYNIIPS